MNIKYMDDIMFYYIITLLGLIDIILIVIAHNLGGI
jgi:hypothetical protein